MPKIRDVANKACVSTATVSHVLNDSRLVSATLRKRVLVAVRELGYTPDPLARSLRTRRSNLIALVIPDISNPYFPDVARGAQDGAEAHGYLAIVCNTDWQGVRERRFLEMMLRQRVGGVILNPAEVSAEELFALQRSRIPIVLVGQQIDHPALDRVAYDNMAATHDVLEHLYARGHRAVAHIGGIQTTASGRLRRAAYLAWVAKRGLPVRSEYVSEGDFTQEGGHRAMQRLLACRPRPTAVFAANDFMALGALLALQEAGVAVPKDVAVVGFDNIERATYSMPPLTTVGFPRYEMGKMAVDLLFQRILRGGDRKGEQRCLPHELIVRASTGG